MRDPGPDPRSQLVAICTILALNFGDRSVMGRLQAVLPVIPKRHRSGPLGQLWGAGVGYLDADVNDNRLAQERALIQMRIALRDICRDRLGLEEVKL